MRSEKLKMKQDTTLFTDEKHTSFSKFKGILCYLFANLIFEVQPSYPSRVGLTFTNKLNYLFYGSKFGKNRRNCGICSTRKFLPVR